MSLDNALASSFENYFVLLARWNTKVNLTAFNLAEPNDEAIDRLLIEPSQSRERSSSETGRPRSRVLDGPRVDQ